MKKERQRKEEEEEEAAAVEELFTKAQAKNNKSILYFYHCFYFFFGFWSGQCGRARAKDVGYPIHAFLVYSFHTIEEESNCILIFFLPFVKLIRSFLVIGGRTC